MQMIKDVRTLYGFFHECATIQPNHPLYRFNKQNAKEETMTVVSYGEFDEYLQKVILAFKELGIGPGKRVAVMGETSVQWIATYVATVTLGGTIVPLDPMLLEDELFNFMRIAEVSYVSYGPRFVDLFKRRGAELENVVQFISCDRPTFTLDPEQEYVADKYSTFNNVLALGKYLYNTKGVDFDLTDHDTRQMSILLFTSGTTGTSKGVMLCEDNVCSVLRGIIPVLDVLSPTDSVLSVLPIYHTYEMSAGILAPMLYGCTVNISDGIKYVGKNIKQFKPSVLALVPMFANQLYKTVWNTAKKNGIEKKLKFGLKLSRFLKKIGIDVRRKIFKQVHEGFGGNLKYMIVGAAALNNEIAQGLYDMGIQVSQGYGITECAPLISVVPFTVKNFASCGQPMPGLEVIIDKENEDDLSGEIVVKGDNVMLGYFKNPQQTAEVLTEDGWFRTGDYGYMDKKGFIYITGRKKNIIISSDGKNIFPEEIEEYLENLDLVSEVVVVGRNSDKTHDIEIVAIVYPDEEECLKAGLDSKEAIHAELTKEVAEINKQLATYKHINRIELRDEPFEKTTTRKIKRNLVK